MRSTTAWDGSATGDDCRVVTAIAANTHGAIVGQLVDVVDVVHGSFASAASGASDGVSAASPSRARSAPSVLAMSVLATDPVALVVPITVTGNSGGALGIAQPGPPLASDSWSAAKFTKIVRSRSR